MIFNIKSPAVYSHSSTRVNVSSDTWSVSQRSQRDWSLRLSREFEICKGSVLFCTFTFKDDCLQYLRMFQPFVKSSHDFVVHDSFVMDNKGERVKCFDNERFSEKVCRKLRKDGFKFKYILFPEYGSDDYYVDDCGRTRKGTKRPHYHVLFFFYHSVDVEQMKKLMLEYWDACIELCLDCVEITDNYGFSTYVSKYVAKGLEKEIFPAEYFDYIKRLRSIIKKYHELDYNALSDYEKFMVQYAVDSLHDYEVHRPKVLCSNGIGSLEFSDEEIMKGSTNISYHSQLHPVAIPSYNLRKQTNCVGSHYVSRFWHIKDGKITMCKDNRLKRYHYILTDFGKDCRDNWLRLRYDDFVAKFDSLVKNTSVISYDALKYLETMEYDVDIKTYRDGLVNVVNDWQKLYPTLSLCDALFYYRSFYARHSLWQLRYYFGSAFAPDNIDVRCYVSMAQTALNTQYDYEDCFVAAPCTHSSLYLEDFNTLLYRVKLINGLFTDLQNACAYAEYMERKLEFGAKKRVSSLSRLR